MTSQTETPDIVTMLRNPNHAQAPTLAASMMQQAADEIERLREAAKGSLIIVQHAERLRKEVEAEAARLRSELARTKRNRDMWKGQCERQAEKLTRASSAASAASGRTNIG